MHSSFGSTVGIVILAFAACDSSSKNVEHAASAAPSAPAAAPEPQVAGPGAPSVEQAPKPADDGPVLGPKAPTRAEAIKQAQNAGILGTLKTSGGGLTGTGTGAFNDANIYGSLNGDPDAGKNSGFGYGGLGLKGTGSGGTGGIGTLGTGRYGPIGPGTSSGYGGGMRGRPPCRPTVALGLPTTAGDLDKAIIRRYIRRNIQKLTYCYEKQLLAKPTLAGRLTATFMITGDRGLVTNAKGSGVDPEIASCFASVIGGIQFPKPKDERSMEVSYPFTLTNCP